MEFIEFGTQSLEAHVVFTFEGSVEQGFKNMNEGSFIAESPYPLEHYTGKKGEIVELFGIQESPIRRIIIVGLGKKKRIPTWNHFRQAIREATGRAVRYARSKGYAEVVFTQGCLLEDTFQEDTHSLYYDIAYAAQVGLYQFSMKSIQEENPDPMIYLCGKKESHTETLKQAIARGKRLGIASSFVRDLVNTPSNIVTPSYILEKAHSIATEHHLKITALDRKAIQKKGMNAFYAVAQGSQTEPYCILLEYIPQGKEQERPIAIIGKGLVFDSGGISLKPSTNMHEMKADMAGAGTALGLATLLSGECTKRVIIALACAENMPSGTATRPGDVVTTLSGKTVEILNTDAEGRLVLCDTLTYVQNEYNPSTIIDMATLTGACAMALGEELTGLFTDDDAFARMIKEAGRISGQQVWRLPMMEEMFIEDITSTIADLQNIGKSRYAGATTAALFLKQFIQENVRYAHLDIAGTAYSSIKSPLTLGSATSAPLAMVFTLLTQMLNKE